MATTSRRVLLAAPTAALAVVPARMVSPWGDALVAAHEAYGDDPVTLVRSKGGRSLSRCRYHSAEGFFLGIGREPERHSDHLFYLAGIVAQLALSAYLLDIGFDDNWCARHVGLRVAKALGYANATGFGHDCAEMERLAVVLTPYWKWNTPRLWSEPAPDHGGFAVNHISRHLRSLLDRVREVTGHPQPCGL